MSPGTPTTDHCEGESPGSWPNTSNYVTISVKGLALGHKHQHTHSAFPLLIATQWPGLRIKCYTILTHIKYFFLHFCGIAEVWYHKAIEEDVKGSAGNVRNAASRCVDTPWQIYFCEKQTRRRELTFNIRIMVPLPGCCVFVYFCRQPQYFGKNSVGL